MATFPDLSGARELFDLPRDVAYLNAAYMGPMPRAAVTAGQKAYQTRVEPWRISVEQDFFGLPEEVRAVASTLLNAAPDDIALVPAASYGLATAAANIKLERGQEIVILEGQFPSNVYIWHRLAERDGGVVRTVSRRPDETWSDALEAVFGPATGVLACPAVHWIDGGLIDLARLRPVLIEAGAALVLDLTQSLGVMAFDVRAIDPDFVVAAGYKWLLGPYSTGVLYVAPRWQQGTPLEENWITRKGSSDFARLIDYRAEYEEGARRFDMGERSAFHTMPALLEALRVITHYEPEAIASRLGELTAELKDAATELGLDNRVPERAPHYLALSLPHGAPDDLLIRLAERRVHVSQRGASIRVSPHIYNDGIDIDRFTTSLKAIFS